jgi:PIN domain nuclease of toxin-antitoxin system
VSDAILDSSALLAMLWGEPGSELVEEIMAGGSCAMSAVNAAEVATRLTERGATRDEIDAALASLPVEILPFDRSGALAVGELVISTRDAGLSLADRAALGLALALSVPAYTADRAWLSVSVGVDVRLIRPGSP